MDINKPRLIHGDCLEVLSNEKQIANLVAVDPPYGTTQNKWDIVIPFEPMWEMIKRVLKPGGIVVFTTAQPYTSQLVMSNPDWYRYDIIWEKTIGSGQLNINRQPLRVHEHILVFYDKPGTYNEQTTKGKPYSITRKADDFEGNYGAQKEHTSVNKGVRRARSVVKISNPRIKNGHKTEKPVELMEYIVKTYSNEGDTVLDFAMGHGTTGIACLNLKRNFIGVELTDEWYGKTVKRFEDYDKKMGMFK
jgi:site-specific DNA-methyltransferase (adenine-specific)